MRRHLLPLVALVLVACSTGVSVTPDAGDDAGVDAGIPDGAIAADTGVDASDVGNPDSASDAGNPDSASDAGNPDSASDAGDAAVRTSTGGSGGVACTRTGTLASGRTYCVGVLGGSEFKLELPPAPTGPLRLVAFLHGDGAVAYLDDSTMEALVPWADAHGAAVLAVKSPNACAWWQHPTQTDCTPTAPFMPDLDGLNADALRAVLDGVRAGYDVTLGPAFYYGSSGGSVFLTRSFLRRFGDRYPGYYALNCGGEKSPKSFEWDVMNPAKRGPTRLYFTYGDLDFLRSDIEVAIPYFAGLGFPTDSVMLTATEHCAFDTNGRAQAVFSAALGE